MLMENWPPCSKAPGYFPQQKVTIKGEVNYPGSYVITSKNERVSDLLKRAGGLTKYAYAPGATLKRTSIQEQAQKQKLLAMAASDTTVKIDSAQLAQIKQNKTLVELQLQNIIKHPGGPQDYVLKNGDVIFIPAIKQTVRVVGAVLNPMSLMFDKNLSLKAYINKSGGFAKNAKKTKVYILYANGTTATRFGKIEPGCQIIVPKKPKKLYHDTTAKILGYASVLSSIAVTLVAIFRK